MKIKDLMGKKVYDKDALEVGKIVDIDMDASFAITTIYVKAGYTKVFALSPQDIDKVGDTIILKIGKESMREK